jgi:hypothetical protein
MSKVLDHIKNTGEAITGTIAASTEPDMRV